MDPELRDRDGDGFVEYERLHPRGLINQGWKDSWDGINFADGTLAEPPIALCEVQAYTYSAYLARSWMAHDAGDVDLAVECRDRAALLKKQFNERFWLPERGYYAIALDGKKRPVDACASNMGQCLLLGIVDKDKAPLVAQIFFFGPLRGQFCFRLGCSRLPRFLDLATVLAFLLLHAGLGKAAT